LVRLAPERVRRRELERAAPPRLEPRAAPALRPLRELLEGWALRDGCELRELEPLRLCVFRFTDPDRDDPERFTLDLPLDLPPPRRCASARLG
jgi:hypothetical protein